MQKSTRLAVEARALLSKHLRSAIQPLPPILQGVCDQRDTAGEALLGGLTELVPYTVTSEPCDVTVRVDERVGWRLRFLQLTRNLPKATRTLIPLL